MNKQTQKVVFSSKSAEWETPQDFFDRLDDTWNFTLDPCCTKVTAKCKTFYTASDDGLSKDWGGHTVFMNPPYGRTIGQWVKKAYEEGKKKNTCVVCLLPARTCTKWFHNYCMKADQLHFVKGRLKFRNRTGSLTSGKSSVFPAPFPSVVVIFGCMASLNATNVTAHTMER